MAENIGYDAEKKVSGFNGHIGVDTKCLPHFIEIWTANVLIAQVHYKELISKN